MRLKFNTDRRRIGVILLFTVAVVWAATGFIPESVHSDTKAVDSANREASCLDKSSGGDENHPCGGSGEHDPGFVCPNAGKPESFTGREPVLQEKCGSCPNYEANSGECPGKYV